MKTRFLIVLAALLPLIWQPASAAGMEDVADSTFVADTDSADTLASRPLTRKELHRLKVQKRNFHYNILGGPSFAPDYGFLVGGSALMTFSLAPSVEGQQRSVVPIAMAVMFNGGVNIVTRPQLFFPGDRFRIFGEFTYKSTEEHFYGVGYETNRDFVRGKTTSQFRYNGFELNPWFLFRVGQSGFFLGPQIDLSLDKMTKPADGIVADATYQQAGGDAQGYRSFSSGVGVLLSYDTRDVPANAYRGVYFNVQATAYARLLGSDDNFCRTLIDYRQYLSVGKRKVLAWTVQSKNLFGDIPLGKYALTGTPFDLRGYYMGQYRDKTSHVVLAEYRQMINTDKRNFVMRMLNHVGFTVWGGCGFMGPNPVDIQGVLPNVGLGLRIEVQPRMNLRLDFGRNMVNKQNLFYFNMTEAF